MIHYHLPGLFEFYDFYKEFLPIFYQHRDWFYDWCDIGSIYGAPADCLWGGGRVGFGDNNPTEVAALLGRYGISARLTFSNSLLEEKHLRDKTCNKLCGIFAGKCEAGKENAQNGIILCSDILMDYISEKYPDFYFVSSTTKVITDFETLLEELSRQDFSYVVPDFRFNNRWDLLEKVPVSLRGKVEFLCNEACYPGCFDRKNCYENVSRKSLGEACRDHICCSPDREEGYRFSKAMKSPAFISIEAIRGRYEPMGFTEYKIEGRSLGSALILEFLLYYTTKPSHQLEVREKLYLDASLDLF